MGLTTRQALLLSRRTLYKKTVGPRRASFSIFQEIDTERNFSSVWVYSGYYCNFVRIRFKSSEIDLFLVLNSKKKFQGLCYE